MSPAERMTARRIAVLIAKLMPTDISRDKLMIEIDRQFPDASFKSFLAGLFLFEETRGRTGSLH